MFVHNVLGARAARWFPVIGFLTSTAVHAQAGGGGGTVSGRVIDAKSGAPLYGARASIDVPQRVGVGDEGGRYAMRNIPAGQYGVAITALGYKPVHQTVTVTAGHTTTLDVAMEQGSLLVSGVVSTATRTPEEASRVASTVNTLTPDEIKASPARESQDLLREMPEVELPRTSSLVGGTAQIASIRGVDEGRTGVFLDGIPVTDAWGEWIDWGRVPMASLDHVEVLEGGGASLYGNPSMGGVISFFSRPVNPGSYLLRMDGTERSGRHAAGSVAEALGPVTAQFFGDYGDGGGYLAVPSSNCGNTGWAQPDTIHCVMAGPVDKAQSSTHRNGNLRLDYAPSSNLNVFVDGTKFGDDRYTGTFVQKADRQESSADVGVNYGGWNTGIVQFRAWDGHMEENTWGSSIQNATTTRSGEVLSATQTLPSHDWGANVQWGRSGLFGLDNITVGGDYRNLTGFVHEADFATSGVTLGDTTHSLFSGGVQKLYGVFIHAVYSPVAPMSIELGARADYWGNDAGRALDTSYTYNAAGARTATTTSDSLYANKTYGFFSPRIGASYRPTDNLTLRAAAYKAFRAPNLNQLYRRQFSGSTTRLPNPALGPESVNEWEGGFDYQPIQWLQLKTTYYHADMINFNTFVVIGTNLQQRQNVEKIVSKGAVFSVAVRPIQPLLLSASVNYDDDKITAAGTSTAVVGSRVGRVPLQKQVIKGAWTDRTFGEWELVWRHEGVGSTVGQLPLQPYSAADASFRRAMLPGAAIFASLENITNTQYQASISGAGTAANPWVVTLGMPRTFRLGLELNKQ